MRGDTLVNRCIAHAPIPASPRWAKEQLHQPKYYKNDSCLSSIYKG